MSSMSVLFGALAPSSRVVSSVLGIDVGFGLGSFLVNSFTTGSAIEEESKLLQKRWLAYRAQQDLRNTAQSISIQSATSSARHEVAGTQNTYAAKGVAINRGTAAQTAQSTREMLVRHSLLSVFG